MAFKVSWVYSWSTNRFQIYLLRCVGSRMSEFSLPLAMKYWNETTKKPLLRQVVAWWRQHSATHILVLKTLFRQYFSMLEKRSAQLPYQNRSPPDSLCWRHDPSQRLPRSNLMLWKWRLPPVKSHLQPTKMLCIRMLFKSDLAMAILPAGFAPWIRIQDGKLLRSTLRKGIIELGFVRTGPNPHALGISKEHA